MPFPSLTHAQLVQKVRDFDSVKYSKTRNFLNGGVSQFSPYITHGVITIEEIVRLSLEKYSIDQAEMRYKELLRREYFTQVHYRKGDDIFRDMEEDKTKIAKQEILPAEIASKTFSSGWVNQSILQLETTGYLHNHQRMWLASYMTHRQKLDRRKCADRSYYHFLDGELGSNHLSRQRVQSTFSHKAYYMNEENLQRYGKFQDPIYRGSYEEVEQRIFDPKRGSDIRNSPDIHDTLQTDLSNIPLASTQAHIYDGYTILTPRDLHSDKIKNPAMTVCVLDPAFFALHPRSAKRIAFVKSYCDIYGINLIQGSYQAIIDTNSNLTIYETRNPVYKQAQTHAIPHHRCSPVVKQGYTKKFFPFWEKTVKHLYALQREIRGN